MRRPSRGGLAGLAPLLLALWLPGCSARETASSEIAVKVGSVALDPKSQTPVLLLEEIGGSRWLPIWIGFAEARAIASELNDVEPPRPGTHDLAKRVIDGMAGRVDRVVVTELAGGIYYAVLSIRTGGGTVEIDARPSDAVAIALRFGAPVFVREGLLEDRSPGGDGEADDGLGI